MKLFDQEKSEERAALKDITENTFLYVKNVIGSG